MTPPQEQKRDEKKAKPRAGVSVAESRRISRELTRWALAGELEQKDQDTMCHENEK